MAKVGTDIKCWRNENGHACANVPHNYVWHSPSGYEWGYAGSGPADLALNILCQFVDRHTAELHHQAFKNDFIVPMPDHGGDIKRSAIIQWLIEKGVSSEKLTPATNGKKPADESAGPLTATSL